MSNGTASALNSELPAIPIALVAAVCVGATASVNAGPNDSQVTVCRGDLYRAEIPDLYKHYWQLAFPNGNVVMPVT
jgi:hypothetical protein